MLDAFVGARVPLHLVTVEAFADAARVAPLTLVNIVDTRSLQDTRAIAAALATAYPAVAALGSRGLRGGNVVLLGAHVLPAPARVRAAAAADRSPARLLDAADVKRLVSGTPPPRDADLGQAPAPAPGPGAAPRG